MEQVINLGETSTILFNNQEVEHLILNNKEIWKTHFGIDEMELLLTQTEDLDAYDSFHIPITRINENDVITYTFKGETKEVPTSGPNKDIILIPIGIYNNEKLTIKGKFTDIYQLGASAPQSPKKYLTIKINNYGSNYRNLGEKILYHVNSDILLPENIKSFDFLEIQPEKTLSDSCSLNWIGEKDYIKAQEKVEYDSTDTTIQYYKFKNAIKNSGVYVINNVAIQRDKNIEKELQFNNGIKILCANLFYTSANEVAGLTSVVFNNDLEEIQKECFSQNSLTALIIPENVKFIGEQAFYRNSLTSLRFEQPKNYNLQIGKQAFNLKSAATIPIYCENENVLYYNWVLDNITGQFLHLDGTDWEKTITPTVEINGSILTISNSNATKYYINVGGFGKETTNTTFDCKDILPGATAGNSYTVEITGFNKNFAPSEKATVTWVVE